MNEKPSDTLQVSCAQMHWARSLERNIQKTKELLSAAVDEGSRVVLFPEANITGYYFPYAVKLPRKEVLEALDEVARAVREAGIWAIVGTIRAWRDGFINLAHVIDPEGRITYEYA
ncbi:nitrilase-related carbon-nitrogen hydrolase, partial [Gemmatimonadota bacterium]